MNVLKAAYDDSLIVYQAVIIQPGGVAPLSGTPPTTRHTQALRTANPLTSSPAFLAMNSARRSCALLMAHAVTLLERFMGDVRLLG